MARLSVVIPAFNEADRLPPTLAEVIGYLGAAPAWLPAELIVVDDGSRDGTADAAASTAVPDGLALELWDRVATRSCSATPTCHRRSTSSPCSPHVAAGKASGSAPGLSTAA
jgi:cellulose synthase/poly-beta-1,6-N-acetylglucosamine synthase-like glycosyltransferase